MKLQNTKLARKWREYAGHGFGKVGLRKASRRARRLHAKILFSRHETPFVSRRISLAT